MSDEHELIIRIEEPASGGSRARVAGPPSGTSWSAMTPWRRPGALAVARDAIDWAVDYDRADRPGPRPG